MRSDEGKRGHLAHALSVIEEEDAYVIYFDDLHLVNNSGSSRTWKHRRFITSAVIPKEKFETMNFSSEELEGLGITVLGSLSAMYAKNRLGE